MMVDNRPAILITGAAGGLATAVVDRLIDRYRLVGVDPRPMPEGRNFPGVFHQIDYRQRRMAEVFRQNSFHALLHLGRVPVTANVRKSLRYSLNVLGTRSLLDLALRFGVKNVIVFSTFHVYGAHQHNHLHITEDDPLRASQNFAELSDAVELDNISTMFLLKNREVRTLILRPVNIVGPKIKNTITQLLRSDFCPVLLGYDPMLQFVHESDIAHSVELCLEGEHSGVYNIAGEGVVPYSHAVRLAGSTPVPIPHFLIYPAAGLLHTLGSQFPKHLVDYFRFPTVVSDAAIRRDFGYQPRVSTLDALKSLRLLK